MSNIKKHYESLDDDTLTRIAVNEADGLTIEATNALVEVLSDRGFDKNLIDNIRKQQGDFSDVEIEKLAERFSQSGCPICKSQERINALSFEQVRGLFVFTLTESFMYIGCKNCLENAKNTANKSTLLLGWWSPEGLFKTPYILLKNNRKFNRVNEDFRTISKDMFQYVKANKGQVVNIVDR